MQTNKLQCKTVYRAQHFSFIKRFIAFFAISMALGGVVAFAAESDLVFYDFKEIDTSGKVVLSGGIYEAPERGALRRQVQNHSANKSAPSDGYYHVRFVADPDAMARAHEFSDFLLNHEAFASVKERFSFEYITGDINLMNCGNNVPQSPRIINCDDAYILSLGTEPAHVTAVYTSRGNGGAGGGGMAIVSIDRPLTIMLHELMHVWTLMDEYTYSQSEAEYYCRYPSILKAPNTTAIASTAYYASNDEAVTVHSNDIPWVSHITLPITTPRDALFFLGTPASMAGQTQPGLFEGSNCSRKLPSFRPYGGDNIMNTWGNNWIPPLHQRIVLAEIARVAGGN